MKPWESDSPGGSDLLSEEEKDKIYSNFGQLAYKIPNHPLFWCTLIKFQVVDHSQKKELTNSTGQCEPEQVREFLLNDILRGPKWKYNAFVHVLHKTNQTGAVSILEQNPELFRSETCIAKDDNQRMLTEEEDGKIRDNFSKLNRTITLGAGFWAELFRFDVLTRGRKDEITNGEKRAKAQQIRSLIDIILRGPKWKYHRFLTVLEKSDNNHVLSYVLDIFDRCQDMCECEGLLSQNDKLRLTKRYSSLTQRISVGQHFWAYLIKYSVINSDEKELLQCDDTKGSIQQMRDFLENFILRGPRWKYHALMKTLVDIECAFLVKLVGEDVDQYKR